MDQDPLDEVEFERSEQRFAVMRTALLILFMASCAGAFFVALLFSAFVR